MKSIYSSIVVLLLMLVITSCQKSTPAQPRYPKVIDFSYSGFALKDTVEMVLDNKVIDVFNANQGFRKSQFIGMKSESQLIAFRRKGSKINISEITLKNVPRKQTRSFYFDGVDMLERPNFEPVSNTVNYGFRLAFLTSFSKLLKEPVDIHIFEWKTRSRPLPRISIYTPVTVIRNVTNSLGDHFELPPFIPETGTSKYYLFKIYKAGTTEPPFIPGTDLSAAGPDYETGYGQFQSIGKGKTVYVVMDVYLSNGRYAGFNPQNVGSFF